MRPFNGSVPRPHERAGLKAGLFVWSPTCAKTIPRRTVDQAGDATATFSRRAREALLPQADRIFFVARVSVTGAFRNCCSQDQKAIVNTTTAIGTHSARILPAAIQPISL